jgi:GT2 family glycosyltransferase
VDAQYVHTDHRLLPQAARNCGAKHAHGKLLAFTDPDIYPAPDWLGRLGQAVTARHAVVLGSISCFGKRWLARGVHLCKFNICLPGGEARSAPLGWSGNVLVEREVFDSLGGWDEEYTQGDTAFTSRVRSTGGDLWFEPHAVVEHDHGRLRFVDFLRERYDRGFEFAAFICVSIVFPNAWSTYGIVIHTFSNPFPRILVANHNGKPHQPN